VGMSAEVREQIFTPFFTTKGHHGTGMGLTMVFVIVQRHDGRIEVVSEPQQGTQVRVYLPVRVAPSSSLPAPLAVAGAACRILVVDDDETVRRVLVRLFTRLGHHTLEAQSGAEALQQLAKEPIAILCTDLGMPGMSGWELITRARELVQGLGIILVTGWGEQLSLEEARARGANMIIGKPFEVRRLQQVLAELTEELLKAEG
jgi:CheY-like chemotaxis protein